MNLVEAAQSPKLFGPSYSGESWNTWWAVLKAAYCLPMTPVEIEVFRSVAERDPPTRPVKEFWCIAGRRAGKDSIAALIATFSAISFAGKTRLRPGERAVVMCLAVDRIQARIIFSYVRGLFEHPLLAPLIERETSSVLELTTGCSIEIHTSDYRAVRGRTILVSVLDEVAFWQSDNSVSPDTQIYDALVPSLATLPGSLLVGISSPYRRSGLLWERWRRHYGRDEDDVLVVRAPSRVFNPSLDQRIIDRAMERDSTAAMAEWMAEFRTDIEGYVTQEVIDSCTIPGRHELPRVQGNWGYQCFVDPSGGSADSFTLAVAHREKSGTVVLDCVREIRPPFSPESATEELAATVKQYGLSEVTGDKYAGEWPSDRFKTHSIRYIASERTKSDIYREMLPTLNAGRVELLDNRRLHAQLLGLERRTVRGGRDSIDHAPNCHDVY